MANGFVVGLVLLLAFSSVLLVKTEEESNEEASDNNDSGNPATNDGETQEESPSVAEENDVLVLNDENFDQVVKDKDIILVEFYAPW